MKILEGIRVADFTWGLSGPSATQILGDLGADVIKIEGYQGDDQRTDHGSSKLGEIPAGFVAYNRNKRSIVLDLKTDTGLRAARRLATGSDVIVQNFRTGVMGGFGLDYPTVSSENPTIIYCSISGYGSEGPLARKAANDIAIQARSGLMSITGYPGQAPVRAHGYPADLTTGIYAALGVLAALHYRDVTGQGQLVEVSMMGTVMSLLGRVFGEYLVDGYVPQPLGSGSDMGTPNGAFPTSDGWITISAVSDDRWTRCCEALGVGYLAREPKYATREERRALREEIIAALSAATSKMTRDEAEAALESRGVSCSPIRTIKETAEDPNFQSQFVEVPLPGGATATNVRSPLRFSLTPTEITHGVPSLGEHGEEIFREIGFSDAEIDETLTTSKSSTRTAPA